MCRGDHRENIFLDDGDREMMLATLAETVGKTGWHVHAWVWMGNHYHGEEIKAHGEARARALLAAGLAGAGLKVRDLPGLPESDRRKVVIATRIRQQTAVPLAWIAEQLHMGTPSHVSHACHRHSSFRLS